MKLNIGFTFLLSSLVISLFTQCQTTRNIPFIQTVSGSIPTEQLGLTLIHEHVLVDFIGADSTGYHRWDKLAAVELILPHLKSAKMAGCQTFVECTPAYLGRDPKLLKILADSSGLKILTNTGYYGAVNSKYLPPHAFTETADQLAARWIKEWKNGIENTGVKPGFIKISVNPDTLSELHEKIVRAAARTHLKTGLTIASHTGIAVPAFEQMTILEQEGVALNAFIWVHAQNEADYTKHEAAAKKGVWISLDGVQESNIATYCKMLTYLKSKQLLHKALISHDAGWYRPNETNENTYRTRTLLFLRIFYQL